MLTSRLREDQLARMLKEHHSASPFHLAEFFLMGVGPGLG